MKRTLSLQREALTALTTDELADIAGANGGPQPTPPIFVPHTLPITYCFAISGGAICDTV